MEINRGQLDLPEHERAHARPEHRAVASARAARRAALLGLPDSGARGGRLVRRAAVRRASSSAIACWRGCTARRRRGKASRCSTSRARAASLILAGTLQTSLGEEFTYHEPLVHIPMFAHPNPHRVLIIGGGDGGALRHVLLHPSVDRALEVEIDQAVVEASLRFLPEISDGAYTDPRAELQDRRWRAVSGRNQRALRRHPGRLDRSGRPGGGADRRRSSCAMRIARWRRAA